ncbi:MAG: sugar transferase [Patescibacteria group bacterium]|nr:sugar transferase [Patescibacteria group bacterium]
MKKPDLTFSILLLPLDYLMLILTALTIYWLRFEALVELRPVIFEIHFKTYFGYSLLISLFFLLIFAASGLYSPNPRKEFSKIFLASSSAVMIIILTIFFSRELFSSRFIILAAWLFSILYVYLGRKVFRLVWRKILVKTKIFQKIVCLGSGQLAEDFVKIITQNPSSGYQIVAWLRNPADLDQDFLQKRGEEVDEIILLDPSLSRAERWRLLSLADDFHLPFKYLADPFDAQATNVGVETFFGLPLISIKRTSLEGWGKVAKRIFDLVFSILFLILFFPLFLIISLVIKIDSEGPVFVKLKRVGERGKIFSLLKFRSMIRGAEKMKKNLLPLSERKGPLFKMENDPRITRFGKFLRKTSLDELPQLVNVLKGEMSLVGPRPHEPEEVALYENYQKRLLNIKPGMTGLAQIYGRSNLPFEEEAKIDIYYIENWSIWKDLEIILKTIPLVLSGKGAK